MFYVLIRWTKCSFWWRRFCKWSEQRATAGGQRIKISYLFDCSIGNSRAQQKNKLEAPEVFDESGVYTTSMKRKRGVVTFHQISVSC